MDGEFLWNVHSGCFYPDFSDKVFKNLFVIRYLSKQSCWLLTNWFFSCLLWNSEKKKKGKNTGRAFISLWHKSQVDWSENHFCLDFGQFSPALLRKNENAMKRITTQREADENAMLWVTGTWWFLLGPLILRYWGFQMIAIPWLKNSQFRWMQRNIKQR